MLRLLVALALLSLNPTCKHSARRTPTSVEKKPIPGPSDSETSSDPVQDQTVAVEETDSTNNIPRTEIYTPPTRRAVKHQVSLAQLPRFHWRGTPIALQAEGQTLFGCQAVNGDRCTVEVDEGTVVRFVAPLENQCYWERIGIWDAGCSITDWYVNDYNVSPSSNYFDRTEGNVRYYQIPDFGEVFQEVGDEWLILTLTVVRDITVTPLFQRDYPNHDPWNPAHNYCDGFSDPLPVICRGH